MAYKENGGTYSHPYRQLTAAIIYRAVQDFKRGVGDDRISARKFFYSDWFCQLAIAIDIEPKAIRTRLKLQDLGENDIIRQYEN